MCISTVVLSYVYIQVSFMTSKTFKIKKSSAYRKKRDFNCLLAIAIYSFSTIVYFLNLIAF